MATTTITAVEAFALSHRQALVKVTAADGTAGWGEPVLEGSVAATLAALDQLRPLLLGSDPTQVARSWERMTRATFYRGGGVLSSAVAGLDQALWDLKGRLLQVPVHELLGGAVRDRIRIYGPAGGGEERAGDLALARAATRRGITLLKVVPPGPWEPLETPARMLRFVAQVSELRAAVGEDVDLAVDFHGRLTLPQAIRILPLLEPLHLAFVEEPVRPEETHLLARVVAATSLPVAVGERLYSRAEFLPALQAGVAIVQPDPSHAGGITEVLRIAALAETFGALIAPHCPLGPVALAAALTIAACAPNFLIQEQGLGLHLGGTDGLWSVLDPGPLLPVDGHIPVLPGPGLGVEVDEEAVRAAARQWLADPARATFGTPLFTHEDGSHAEW